MGMLAMTPEGEKANTETSPGAAEADSEPQRSRLSIWKDVVALSVGFTCNYVPFTGLRNVQSSLNGADGLGSTALGLTYVSAILSSFVLPSLMIRALGLKRTIVSCLPFLALYVASNFHAAWYTLAPALVLWGMFAAPMWSAQYSALTAISFRHAHLWGATGEVLNARFFGIFFAVYHLDEIVGNLLSSFILNPAELETGRYGNGSERYGYQYEIDETYDTCGVNYCDAAKGELNATGRPTLSQVYTLCGVYVALCVLGTLIIAVFVHPVERLPSVTSGAKGLGLLQATFRQMLNPKQLLLIPLTVFTGLSQSFMASDFSKAFVNCVLGIHFIGFTMTWAGVTDAAFSLLFGISSKRIHRSVVYVSGAAINVSLYVIMMLWSPQPTQAWLLYAVAGLWGITDAVWQTHFCGFYGVLFEDNSEVAYSVFQLWQFVGLLIGYFWSHFVCVRPKIYILLPFVLLGIAAYAFVEILHSKQKKSEKASAFENNNNDDTSVHF